MERFSDMPNAVQKTSGSPFCETYFFHIKDVLANLIL